LIRRTFLASLAASAATPQLAGLPLAELRARYRRDLFESVLPFWDKHGIDHQSGGVLHSLDYDGTAVATNKLSWFQGRAIWIYSFLYNHFDRNSKYLEIARKTKEFLLKNAPQPDGWWAEEFTREGKVVKPFSGDLYGMYFAAEGLQEYAWAAKDDKARPPHRGTGLPLHGRRLARPAHAGPMDGESQHGPPDACSLARRRTAGAP
jgi:mannose/cellobiose epimerase-like protein (N-acyl-D-glucosamine 2-epimerase family)